MLVPPQVTAPWQVRLRVCVLPEQALQALQADQLLLVGVFVPPLQEPLHWIVSPVVQELLSLQACPVFGTHPPQFELLEQEFEQEEEVFSTDEQALPTQVE